jgi:hypothetical protein
MKHWKWLTAFAAVFVTGYSLLAWAGQVPNPVNAPASVAQYALAYWNGTNPQGNLATIAPVDNAILATNGSGAPSETTSLPSGITIPAGDLPLPTTTTLGGLESQTCASHQWIDVIPTTQVQPSCAQPGFADLSGQAMLAQLPTISANTILGNATGSSATPTALAVPSCSTAASALQWTTSTGFACNTSISATGVIISGAVSGDIGTFNGSHALIDGGTLSSLLDSNFGNSQGTVLYRGASTWTALTPGTQYQFLQTNGSSANPAWASSVQSLTAQNRGTYTVGSTYFLPVVGYYGSVSTSNVDNLRFERSGSIGAVGSGGGFYCSVLTAPGTGFSDTCTVYINGSGSLSTCTISNTNTSCTDTSDKVTLSANTTIEIEFVANTGATAPGTVYTALSYASP